MAFKTKKEKYAYVKGIKKGMRGGKTYGKKKKPRKTGKQPSKGVKSQPVYDYSKYFDFDSRGVSKAPIPPMASLSRIEVSDGQEKEEVEQSSRVPS